MENISIVICCCFICFGWCFMNAKNATELNFLGLGYKLFDRIKLKHFILFICFAAVWIPEIHCAGCASMENNSNYKLVAIIYGNVCQTSTASTVKYSKLKNHKQNRTQLHILSGWMVGQTQNW